MTGMDAVVERAGSGEPTGPTGRSPGSTETPPSRSEVLRALRGPGLPGVRGAARTALVELWYHPWPALTSNLAWAMGALLALGVASAWPLGGLVLLPLVAVPFAGVMAVATHIVRGEPVDVRDAFRAWRTHGGRAAFLGVLTVVVLAVLAADVVIGLASMGGPVGWALATGAGWALLAIIALLLHAWPLLLDPVEPGRSVGAALRLGARVALVFPGRAAALTLLAAVVLIVATVLFAVLATVAMAWLAIFASVVVLPAADRLTALEDRRG